MRNTILKNCIQTAAALLFLLVCYFVAYAIAGNELLVPAFSDVCKQTGKLLLSGGFWSALGNTLLRTLLALGISFVLALIFALISYLLPPFNSFFTPVVSALRSLPTLAVLLILLVWWGAGDAPVAVAFLSLFPMLYVSVLSALSGVDKDLIEMSRVYNVPLSKRIWELYLPAAAPYVLRETGAALSFSLKLVVSAEVLAYTFPSMGNLMQEARLYDIAQLFTLVGVTFVLGLLLEGLAALLAWLLKEKIQ